MYNKINLIRDKLLYLKEVKKYLDFHYFNLGNVAILLIILTPLTSALAADNIYNAFDVTGMGRPCSKPSSMSIDAAGLKLYTSQLGSQMCVWKSNDPTDRSTVLWGSGQGWSPPEGTYGMGRGGAVGNFYPPFTDNYRMRAHFCPSNSRGTCTIARSTQTMDTVNALKLLSTERINAREHNFGGYNGILSVDSNACYTLVDSKGYEWTGGGGFMCSDGGKLPDIPAICYLNQDMDLSVDMGLLERGKIATRPVSGTTGNIKKKFPVLCTRDAGVTVSTTFQFTPLTINGDEVVATSTANLGVAIFYNGKLVGPDSTPINETFDVGFTDRELEFQAVRNPDTAFSDIPTGSFTASAVMIMTEQ